MKTALRVLLIVLLVGALGAGGWWLYQTQFSTPASAAADSQLTQVIDVTRGDLRASISVVGELYAVQQETLTFDRLSGTTALLSFDAAAGHTVTEGQVLASIDSSAYEQALDQAQSDLQEAEEFLADLTTPPTDLEIAEADLAVAQAQLSVEQAKDSLDEMLDPDTDALQTAVAEAQDLLEQARLDLELQVLDTLYGDERNLLYAIDWHDRRINELEKLASAGQANLEQMDELDERREDLAEAEADLASVRSKMELDRRLAQAEYDTAAAELANAEEALADALEGADALDVAKAELSIAEAELNLAQAIEDRDELGQGADSVDLAAAEASLEKKKLAVSEAEEDLAAAMMAAPFDGTVLQAYVDQGNLITSNRDIVTVANLDNLQVQAAVDETTVRQVSVGQKATITFDAFPGQSFSGEVLAVPLKGELQGGVMVYQVEVSLLGAEELPLLVGMTANVDIEVGQVEDALLVPSMALQNIGGFYQVLVPGTMSEEGDAEAEPEAVPVEVGLSDGIYTQIVRGLADGDQVVVQLETADSMFGGFGGIGMGRMGGTMIMPGAGGPR